MGTFEPPKFAYMIPVGPVDTPEKAGFYQVFKIKFSDCEAFLDLYGKRHGQEWNAFYSFQDLTDSLVLRKWNEDRAAEKEKAEAEAAAKRKG